MSINIFDGLKLKILFPVLTLALILLPFISYAVIPTPNPGGTFSNVDFMTIVTNIANFIIGFITLLGIIFLVYGGLQYVTSSGDESKAEDGKRTITYAMIGLFLATMAYAIEQLVLTTLVS